MVKNKDKKIYPTLRLVVSALKDALIVKRVKDSKPLTDQEVTTVLKKMVKQRTESYEVYKKAGRNELLENEEKEINDSKEIKDCFEKLNRATFKFNQGLDKAIIKPIAKGYRNLPDPIQRGIMNPIQMMR